MQSNQTTGGTPYTFSYTYNLAGALKTETYPDGSLLTTTYDGVNRPITLAGSLSGTPRNYITQTCVDVVRAVEDANNVQSCPNPTVFLPPGQKPPASFTLPGGSGGVTGAPGGGGFWNVVVGYSCMGTSATNSTGSSGTVCSTNYKFVWVQ